jgi:ATP/maltotriose-dependent transcriptional regulator MalT
MLGAPEVTSIVDPSGAGWSGASRLFDRFSATGPSGMILLCRPAGSGNTVLLRSWVDAAGLEDRVGRG